MKITGQILKENRERKGISLNEVAIATKINARSLAAMEEGDLDHLPPKTFLRGFVRAYAAYLELDVDSVLGTFYDEMGTTKPRTGQGHNPNSATNGSSGRMRPAGAEADETINPKPTMTMKVGGVAGILLLVVLIVVLKGKMENYEKESNIEGISGNIESLRKEVDSTNDADAMDDDAVAAATNGESELSASEGGSTTNPTSPTAPDQKPTAGVSPETNNQNEKATTDHNSKPHEQDRQHSDSVLDSAPSKAVVPPPVKEEPKKESKVTETKPATKELATKENSQKAEASKPTSPTEGSASAVTKAPSENKPNIAPPVAPPIIAPASMHEVIIEAMDAVDIEALIDGEPAKKIKLKADQIQSIRSKKQIILNLSDGGAVNLIVDGADRGVPGDLGKPKHVELP